MNVSKKIIAIVPALFVFAAAVAEEKNEPLIDRSLIFDVWHICSTLLLIYMIASFILQLLQRNLDYRIKNKVIEAGSPESVISRLLEEKKKDIRRDMLAWICVLLALGAGLAIVDATLPFGLHSVAILSISIGVGLLAFYLISGLRKKDGA
jgi:hypothetical protein